MRYFGESPVGRGLSAAGVLTESGESHTHERIQKANQKTILEVLNHPSRPDRTGAEFMLLHTATCSACDDKLARALKRVSAGRRRLLDYLVGLGPLTTAALKAPAKAR